MDTFWTVLPLLLLAAVDASPITKVDVDKRRHSTPEILGLEQQLKKAAGENKKFFGDVEGQPPVQVDGLDRDNQELLKSATGQSQTTDHSFPGAGSVAAQGQLLKSAPGQSQATDHLITGAESVVAQGQDFSGFDSQQQDRQPESYMEMWKLFRQHPQLMQDIFQGMQGIPGQDELQNSRQPQNLDFDGSPQNLDVGISPQHQEFDIGGQSQDFRGVPKKPNFSGGSDTAGVEAGSLGPDQELEALIKDYASNGEAGPGLDQAGDYRGMSARNGLMDLDHME